LFAAYKILTENTASSHQQGDQLSLLMGLARASERMKRFEEAFEFMESIERLPDGQAPLLAHVKCHKSLFLIKMNRLEEALDEIQAGLQMQQLRFSGVLMCQ